MKQGSWVMHETLRSLFIVVIVVIALIFIVKIFFDNVDEVNHSSACKASVFAHAKARVSAENFDEVWWLSIVGKLMEGEQWIETISCPPQHVPIETADETQLKEHMAQEMMECWDNFGRGELELFDANSDGRTTYCVVCDIITFEGEEKKVKGLFQHLAQNGPRFEQDEEAERRTYWEVFTGQKAEDWGIRRDDVIDPFGPLPTGFFGHTESDEEAIDTSSQYAITFVYSKDVDGYMNNKATVLYGSGASLGPVLVGGKIGAIAGAPLGPVGVLVGGAIGAGVGAFAGASGTTAALYYAPDINRKWRSSVHVTPLNGWVMNDLGCQQLPARQS